MSTAVRSDTGRTHVGRSPSRPAAPRLRGLALAGLAVMTTMLAACGGAQEEPRVATAQSPSGGVAATPTGAGADRDRALGFVRCMRDEGVQVDDPQPDGKWEIQPGDKTDPEFPAAMEKCKGLFPEVAAAPPGLSAEQLETMRKFAQCMRDNGVPDFADPGPQGFTSQPADAAAAQRAQKTCGSILGIDPNGPGQG